MSTANTALRHQYPMYRQMSQSPMLWWWLNAKKVPMVPSANTAVKPKD